MRIGLRQFVIDSRRTFFVARGQLGIAKEGKGALRPGGRHSGVGVGDFLQRTHRARRVAGSQLGHRRIELGWRVHADLADVGQRDAGGGAAHLQADIAAAYAGDFTLPGQAGLEHDRVLCTGRGGRSQPDGHDGEQLQGGEGA